MCIYKPLWVFSAQLLCVCVRACMCVCVCVCVFTWSLLALLTTFREAFCFSQVGISSSYGISALLVFDLEHETQEGGVWAHLTLRFSFVGFRDGVPFFLGCQHSCLVALHSVSVDLCQCGLDDGLLGEGPSWVWARWVGPLWLSCCWMFSVRLVIWVRGIAARWEEFLCFINFLPLCLPLASYSVIVTRKGTVALGKSVQSIAFYI
jgi:hypothetical protein